MLCSTGTGGSFGASSDTDDSFVANVVPGAWVVVGAIRFLATIPPTFCVASTTAGSNQCQTAMRCGLLARQFGHCMAVDLVVPECCW